MSALALSGFCYVIKHAEHSEITLCSALFFNILLAVESYIYEK